MGRAMIFMDVSWAGLKNFASQRGVSIQYIDDNGSYYLLAVAPDLYNPLTARHIMSQHPADHADLVDFETNFKPLANKNLAPNDSDKSPLMRMKMAPTGWTFSHRCLQVESSVLGSDQDLTPGGAQSGLTSLKLFDSQGVEITDQGAADTNCVLTRLDWEPPFNYELIRGKLRYAGGALTDHVYVSVVGVPDIPAAFGGSKEMVRNLDLFFINPKEEVHADGRASKFLQYDAVYHTNKLRWIIRHPAGLKIQLQFVTEFYTL